MIDFRCNCTYNKRHELRVGQQKSRPKVGRSRHLIRLSWRLRLGYLHRGFVWDPDKNPKEAGATSGKTGAVALIPHHELFHRYHLPRRIRRISATGVGQKAADAFLDLEAGDHVVHADHGIAQFVGLRNMRRSGRTEEYLTL